MAFRAGLANFSKGELGPELQSRIDVQAYNAGLKRGQNVVILKYGGLSKRPGTRFVAEVYDKTAKPVRLLPFQFNDEQEYALEMGDAYMRPAALGGMVLNDPKVVTAITKAANALVSSAAHGYSIGDQLFLSGVAGMLEINGHIVAVATVPDSDSFTIDLNSSNFSAYVGGGTVAKLVRVVAPYAGSDLSELDIEQSADVVYMAHWDYAPTKLLRHSNTDWEFVTVAFGPTLGAPGSVAAVATIGNTDDPNGGANYFPEPMSYVITAIDDDTGQESRASSKSTVTNDLGLKNNFNTITWAAVTGATRYSVYKAIQTGSFGYIGDTESLSFVDDNILADQTQSPPVGFNPFNATGDYPSTVAFVEQRLLWGRTHNIPNAIWGSKSSDFENMDNSRPLRADDSLAFKIVGAKANAVNQLVSVSSLLALTSDSVFKISGGSNEGYLRPDQIVTRRQAGRGMSRLDPLVIDDVVFAQTKSGNEVRSINYTFESDGYRTNDVTIFSPHLFKGFDIIWWAYAEHPRSIIWAGRSDGAILCFTWEAAQQVWGWTVCYTDGFPEAGCVISENGESRLYLIVRRTVGGVDRRYIERMAATAFDGVENACFLDCAITVQLAAGETVVSGLDHLEGRTVSALANGNVVSGLVVTAGKVEIPFSSPTSAGMIVTVGLTFTALVETLPLVVGSEGTTAAKRQTVGRAVLRLVESRGIEAGPDEDHLYHLKPRSDEPYGEPNRLLTGDYEADMEPVISGQSSIVIRSSEPVPLTLTGVLLEPIVTS